MSSLFVLKIFGIIDLAHKIIASPKVIPAKTFFIKNNFSMFFILNIFTVVGSPIFFVYHSLPHLVITVMIHEKTQET